MMKRIWEDALTEEDRIVIEKGGYGKKRGLGEKPLLVIVDTQYNYVGADEPIDKQLDKWPSGGGEKAWKAIKRIQELKKEAKVAGIPVMYNRNVQKKTVNFDSFTKKTARDNKKYKDCQPKTRYEEEIKTKETSIA